MKQVAITVAVFVAVAAIAIGGWFGYWAIAKAGQSNRYDVNIHNQQYQAGLVAQERDRVTAYDRSTDEAQRQAIADQFCAAYLQLSPPTPDLENAHVRLCP